MIFLILLLGPAAIFAVYVSIMMFVICANLVGWILAGCFYFLKLVFLGPAYVAKTIAHAPDKATDRSYEEWLEGLRSKRGARGRLRQ